MLLTVLAAAELEDAGQLAHVLSAEAPSSAESLWREAEMEGR
jgi:hypothetical protein